MTAIRQDDTSIVGRAIRAARLDSALYEEVERDRDATWQAGLIVLLTSLIAGIGLGISEGIDVALASVVLALLGWAAYAYITYLIGTKLLKGPDTNATWGELARTLGFARAPQFLLVLAVIPILGLVVALIVGIWVLVTTVVALRAALDFGTGRAIATGLLGVIVQAIFMAIPRALLG